MPYAYTEALESQAAKEHLPTELRSRLLQELPGVVKARSRFSAAMVHSEYLGTIDSVLERMISGDLDTATALAELDRSLGSLGHESITGRGSVRSHRSFARRKLIIDTNLAQAGNYGQWVQNNSDTALQLYPCWEFYRAFQRQEPRDWRGRWLAAGGTLYEGRMIATKDDPIWINPRLNRLGTPYPPFDFNSGMRLRPIERSEAERLGAIGEGEDVLPAFQEFTAESMSAANLNGGLRKAVADALEGVASFDSESVVRMNALPTYQEYGLQSAKSWESSPVAPPELMDAGAARRLLEEGLPLTDYALRPVIFDRAMIAHWESPDGTGRIKSQRQINGRLERLNWAIETLDDPREHWIDNDHHVYMQVFESTPGRSRGLVVIVRPDGQARTYWIEKGMERLDRTRKGTLKHPGGRGQ